MTVVDGWNSLYYWTQEQTHSPHKLLLISLEDAIYKEVSKDSNKKKKAHLILTVTERGKKQLEWP